MATFHRMADESGREVVRCFVKGAPDQLLARAVVASRPGAGRRPRSTRTSRRATSPRTSGWPSKGLRVMATARKDFDPAGFDPDADLLELMHGLTLLALVGIVDPPRPAAKAAIATAHAAGIQVRMITGDHAITAEAIAQDLGIEGRAITGAQFAELDDDQAVAEIDEIGVIARVTPEQKVRLVDILKRKGHVVGMTGDGVNDAPALKQADIGIAMGITGTEVSKEAAAMILTDDNFATIVKAVELGRGLYDNLVKYIRFQMGVLAGLILTFLGASILNIASGIPFLPLQTLWVNFTTQVFQSVGLGYGAPSEGLMERSPRKPKQPILTRADTRWFVVAGLVMAIGTLAVVGGRRARRRRDAGADDGAHDVRDREPRLLVHDARRPALGVQPGHVQRPDVRDHVAGVGRVDHPGHRVRVPPADPRHRGADRQPVADLHRGGPADRRGLGGPQVPVAPARLGLAGVIAAASRRRGAADAVELS